MADELTTLHFSWVQAHIHLRPRRTGPLHRRRPNDAGRILDVYEESVEHSYFVQDMMGLYMSWQRLFRDYCRPRFIRVLEPKDYEVTVRLPVEPYPDMSMPNPVPGQPAVWDPHELALMTDRIQVAFSYNVGHFYPDINSFTWFVGEEEIFMQW